MLAAALCMTACSQNEDIVIEQPVSDNDFESPDGQLIIQLGGIETRIGASVGVTRAPLDKLYDEAEGATTRCRRNTTIASTATPLIRKAKP